MLAKGFSLLELIIALTIGIIVSLIAISGWQHFRHSNQAAITLQQIASAINFARLEALRRGDPVIFCKSSNHHQCGGSWRDGQLLISAHGKVLRVLEALPVGDTLIWRSSFGRNDALELLPSGYTAGQQGSFYYHAANQNLEAVPVLVVNQTGRVRMEYINKPFLFSQ